MPGVISQILSQIGAKNYFSPKNGRVPSPPIPMVLEKLQIIQILGTIIVILFYFFLFLSSYFLSKLLGYQAGHIG